MIKEFITCFCETCQKKLITKKEYERCFHKNHLIRTKGLFIIKTNRKTVKKKGKNVIMGVALSSALAGNNVMVRI